jgi:hypothetical protein
MGLRLISRGSRAPYTHDGVCETGFNGALKLTVPARARFGELPRLAPV